MRFKEQQTGATNAVWRSCLLWVPVVLWMAVIFFFSAQNGEQSGGLSGGLTEQVVAALTPGWAQLSAADRAARLAVWHLVVRKAAHVTEFAVLGGLLMNAWVRQHRHVGVRQAVAALLCGLLYAVSDELHQMFVPGRGPAVTDVLIDLTGVLAGVLIIGAIMRLFFKNSQNIIANRK